MIDVGDMVVLKKNDNYLEKYLGDRNLTGVVVAVTLDSAPNSQGDEPFDYWIKVVFLDGTKSTLFHDEVMILSKK